MADLPFNPYQPPSEGVSEPSLAPDTEFLFNDKFVAGVGVIELPQVCVVTGEKDSLLPRETRLWWCSRWISGIRNALFLASFVFAVPSIAVQPIPAAMTPNQVFFMQLQMLIGFGIVTGALVFAILVLVLRRAVRVQWYVSSRVVRKHKMLSLIALLSSLAVAVLIVSSSRDWLGVIVLPVVSAVVSAFYLVRGKRVLFIAGRYEQLFLIGGLSRRFMKETQRLVAAYESRNSSASGSSG